jgi:hypothetical protein
MVAARPRAVVRLKQRPFQKLSFWLSCADIKVRVRLRAVAWHKVATAGESGICQSRKQKSGFGMAGVMRAKSHPAKLALAARLRQETTHSVKEIAGRLNLGKVKGARTSLHKFLKHTHTTGSQPQLDF